MKKFVIGCWNLVMHGRSPLTLLLRLALAALVLWSLSRGVLALLHADRLATANAGVETYLIGLRVDLITLGWILALPLLLLPLCVWAPGLRVWDAFSRAWLLLALLLALVLEATAPGFLAEYEVRPNALFLDYLDRPQEVVPMLWGGFRIWLIAGLLTFALGSWLAWRWLHGTQTPQRLRIRTLLWGWPLLVLGCALMIRSTLDHRPANPALFARWDDTLVNQLALNSSYTLGYAVYARKHETDVGAIYGPLAETDLRAWLREDARFADAPEQTPTLHRQSPSFPRARPLNLILVVEESLGAGFSAALGGQGLTPELDRWAQRGWWFEQLYATGTRSVRGLEALVAGFPPSPAESVLKREGAQQGFATLASVLREAGYRCEFIYGGESHFDNMRGFFMGNGFHAVIDQADYPQPHFKGSWGVSDEDLFAKAHARAEALHAAGTPFFSLVFTSSNHTPFEYPQDHLQPVGENPHTVENAVRYADMAVGGFLDRASQSAYFADTLILVVADHDVRVYGDAIVPLPRFRIPGLLVGADLAPRRLYSTASQIDLPPTLLSVMGVEAQIPFPGRDLTRSLPEFGATGGPPPRAVMQFNTTYAHLEDGTLSVLLPGGEARRYRVDGPGQTLSPLSPPSAAARQRLLAEVHLPGWLYTHRAYRQSAAAD